MSASTATFARTQVFNETEMQAPRRLSPAKMALLVGVQVLLVAVCMAVIIREIVAMDESSETSMLLKESSGATNLQVQEPARPFSGLAEQQASTTKKVTEDESLPDCVETGKTKLAKAIWVFLAGALLNSERSRSIIVAGAL